MSDRFPAVFESIQDLTKLQLDALLSLSYKLKEKAKVQQVFPTFGFKTPIMATLFLEHSTRTKTSFAIAGQRLGAMVIDFNVEMSSLKKGESLEETLHTLRHQGVELCVVRSPESKHLQALKSDPPMRIINGGDGSNQHPTQALLDLFTMLERFYPNAPKRSDLRQNGLPDLTGKTIAIVGDILHSRVAHSLMDLLPQYGAKLILCGPKSFFMQSAQTQWHENVSTTHSLDEAIKQCDLLYLLRIQKERHGHQMSGQDMQDYVLQYGVTYDRLKKLDKLVPIYHPGPVNIGVEMDSQLIKSPLYQGYVQVENSIYMRQAIIKTMLEKASIASPQTQEHDKHQHNS